MIYEGNYTLKINQRIKTKTGIFRKDELIFAGMPNDQTYSITITWSSSHNSMAYNLFIPMSQKEIELTHSTIMVKRVSTTFIELELKRK